MKNIANIAMIFTMIPIVIRLALHKELGPEQVALILIVGVFLIAGGKPLIKFFLGIAGLYLFSREITEGIGAEIIFAQLLQLSIVLIGFYVMFKTLFPRSRKKKTD